MVKIKGFTLEGAKNFIKSKEEIQMDNNQPIESTESSEVIAKLETIKAKLIQLKK